MTHFKRHETTFPNLGTYSDLIEATDAVEHRGPGVDGSPGFTAFQAQDAPVLSNVVAPSWVGQLKYEPASFKDVLDWDASWCPELLVASQAGSTWTNSSGPNLTLNGEWWEIANGFDGVDINYGQNPPDTGDRRSFVSWLRFDGRTLTDGASDVVKLFGQKGNITPDGQHGWGVYYDPSTKGLGIGFSDGYNGEYMLPTSPAAPVVPDEDDVTVFFMADWRMLNKEYGWFSVWIVKADGTIIDFGGGDGVTVDWPGTWETIPPLQIPSSTSGIGVYEFGIADIDPLMCIDGQTPVLDPQGLRRWLAYSWANRAGLEYPIGTWFRVNVDVSDIDSFSGVAMSAGDILSTSLGGVDPSDWAVAASATDIPKAWQGGFNTVTMETPPHWAYGVFDPVQNERDMFAWSLSYPGQEINDGDIWFAIYTDNDGFIEIYLDNELSKCYIAVMDDEGGLWGEWEGASGLSGIITQQDLDDLSDLCDSETPIVFSIRLLRASSELVIGINDEVSLWTFDVTGLGSLNQGQFQYPTQGLVGCGWHNTFVSPTEDEVGDITDSIMEHFGIGSLPPFHGV